MKYGGLVLLLCLKLYAEESWVPDSSLNPREVYWSALADADSERYDLAHQKYIWLYTESSSRDAVKNSYYVGSLAELSEVYPPAKESMLKLRDTAEWLLLEGMEQIRPYSPAPPPPFEFFQRVAAFNHAMNAPENTVAVFKELDEANPKLAKRLHMVAKEEFILLSEYDLFMKYLDPNREADQIIMFYESALDYFTDDEQGQRMAAYSRFSFSKSACTLVAVLVQTGNPDLAKELASRFEGYLTDDSFSESMAAALRGQVPTKRDYREQEEHSE